MVHANRINRRSMLRPISLAISAVSFGFAPSIGLRHGAIYASALSANPAPATTANTKHFSTDAGGGRTKRIAIVGAGAVGSYYGGRLWESVRSKGDTNVMFHLRGEHYNYGVKNGIDVSSYHGDFSIPAQELLAFPTTQDMANSEDGGAFDWVVCALKSTSVSASGNLLIFLCMKLQPG